MVAFVENTEVYAHSPPRARGQNRSCIFGDSLRDKPNESIELRSTNYTGHARLGTCSKDPIGYEGGSGNLYQYVLSKPIDLNDPRGLNPYIHADSDGPWQVIDFFNHYGGGHGQAIDLKDVGLLDTFVGAVQGEVAKFERGLMNELDVDCENPAKAISRTQSFQYAIGGGYFDPMTVMGKGYINATISCSASMACTECPCQGNKKFPVSSEWKCTINYAVRDRFANPLDWHGHDYERDETAYQTCISKCWDDYPMTFPYVSRGRAKCFESCEEKYPRSEWWGHTPYDITASWSEKLGGTKQYGGCP